ncbi:nicotinate-nucleotide--dimethylbenzimidazole phosphoribosyltransferase [Tunturibacter empetritectus]|uniref:Nicotinate-nucleotide--dimethylbenzimidazole phosphoribosyltransferase n=2 Tax=Tunturiibacter empetritectus TaxID=3069691 RepID=A0A7W8MRR6_9BACT|nr:nicotinate-nucleotide--dimethylbenzimidazole phosphoribosyltransferase [Edaphobacter lichenicola]MBB5317095.1 nicotinate-nucleotide--dimethylbenzimidazole phosphoribosyltransferase [Edaphobacter lichenicola]
MSDSNIMSTIEPPSELWLAKARAHLDVLTKPLGSLGRLEDLAAQLVSIRQREYAEPLRKAVYIFAADHGITAEGVSAYPSEVTRQMVLNFLANGAAINVLAKLHGVEMNVVDVGVDADFDQIDDLLHRKVRKGTRNMIQEPAMSSDELTEALGVGLDLADDSKAKGHSLVAVGEMGIGNTTAASAITSLLTRKPVELTTGKGTGLNTEALQHKRRIIEAVLQKYFGEAAGDILPDPVDVLRIVGGLEIAAMTGFILGAARHGIAVVVDGFISTAAAALAFALVPQVRGYLFAGHQSEEPGHQALLDYLELRPILALNMRLGEGTGAVLAMPILESAMCLYNQMATFESAGVSEAKD